MKNLELYVHIPFCVKKCAYCDFLSGAYDADIRRQYTEALIKEIEYYGNQYKLEKGMYAEETVISTVYIGGGTPSWLETDLMEEILKQIYISFEIMPDAEFTIEVNPGTVTAEALNIYRSYHINRISIGLQSANNDELKLLGRIHDYNRFLHTYELVRNSGFTNVSVDVMTGLPGQTLEKLQRTLECVVRLKPEHISAYSLIIEEGTLFYELYKFDAVKQHAGMETEFLPSEDEEYALSKFAERYLDEHGYRRYEVSNYARPGFEGKHNSGYWKREQYLGLGLGASSQIGMFRYKNETDMYKYIENPTNRIEEIELSKSDAMSEFMYLGLRMTEGVKRDDFEKTFSCSIEAIFGDALNKLEEEGMLVRRAGVIYLTELGMDLSNYVFSNFIL